MDETAAESEVPDQQQQSLATGLQYAYTVPSSNASDPQQVRRLCMCVCVCVCGTQMFKWNHRVMGCSTLRTYVIHVYTCCSLFLLGFGAPVCIAYVFVRS